MASLWAVTSVVLAMALPLGASITDRCPDTMMTLYSCVINQEFDYTRVDDPSYRQELCSKVHELESCVDSAREECPDLSAGDIGRQLQSNIDHLKTRCVDRCPDVMTSAQRCIGMVHNLGGGEDVCQMAGNFLPCAEDLRERCEHQELYQYIQESMDNLVEMMTSACARRTTPSNGDESQECPDTEEGFWDGINECHEPLYVPLSGSALCDAFEQARTCSVDLINVCQGRPWLSEAIVQQIHNEFRVAMENHMCDHY